MVTRSAKFACMRTYASICSADGCKWAWSWCINGSTTSSKDSEIVVHDTVFLKLSSWRFHFVSFFEEHLVRSQYLELRELDAITAERWDREKRLEIDGIEAWLVSFLPKVVVAGGMVVGLFENVIDWLRAAHEFVDFQLRWMDQLQENFERTIKRYRRTVQRKKYKV